MPQCCSDPACIFADDFEDGSPLTARYIDDDNNPGTNDCTIEDGVGINGSRGLHSSYSDPDGLDSEAAVHFTSDLDQCGNLRTEFAVGFYANYMQTTDPTGGSVCEIRKQDFAGETIITIQRIGPGAFMDPLDPTKPAQDLVVLDHDNNEAFRIRNAFLLGTYRKYEFRGSIGAWGTDGWIECRLDGIVYQNGDNVTQINPDDPKKDCPSGNPITFLGPNTFSEPEVGWDKVWFSPNGGDLDCIYIKEVAQYCNDSNTDPNSSSRRCPPPGPGGSSFDGSASGPRVVQPGGFTNWTYTPPVGGGVPSTAPDPVEAQSLIGADTLDIAFDLTLCDLSVVCFSQVPVVASSGLILAGSARQPAQPLVTRFGTVEYPLSDRFGNFRGQVWDVDIADPDGTIRGYLESATNRFFKRWEGHLYGESDAARLAGTARRSLARGRVMSVTSPDDEVVRLTMCDEFSRQDSPFTLDRPVPQFKVGDLFYQGVTISCPGITFLAQTTPDDGDPFDSPPQNVRDMAIPIIYGEASDDYRWAENPPITPAGICKPRLIGDVLLKNGTERWQLYLAAQYAIQIDALFGSDLDPACPASVRLDIEAHPDQFLVPGHGQWSAYFPTNALDIIINSVIYRFTVFFARGPVSQAHVAGTVPISFNARGIDTHGDTTGTMIDDIAYVCQHMIDHAVIQKTLTLTSSTSWGPVAAFLDGTAKLRTSSFAAVQAIHAARLSSRYRCRLIMDQQKTAKEWLADILISGDMRLGVNHHGQLYLTALDDAQDLTTLPTFTDVRDIREGTFAITSERSSELETSLRYDWGPEPATGRTTGDPRPYESTEAVRNWGDSYPALAQTFTAVGSQAMADDVAARRISFTKDGLTHGEFASHATITDILPSALCRATDFRGLGSTGWTNRVLFVESVVFNPNVSDPPQAEDHNVIVRWVDKHDALVAPAGMVGGGTTSDGTTTRGIGFVPLGSSTGSPSTGWVLGSSFNNTGWRLGVETPVIGSGGIDMPVSTPAGSS